MQRQHPAAGSFPFFSSLGMNCRAVLAARPVRLPLRGCPPPLPLPPAAPEGGGAIRYATFLFPARLTGWARKALMFSDRPPLIVGAFLLCLFCEILT